MEQTKQRDKETWSGAFAEVFMRFLDVALIAVFTYLIVRSGYNPAIIFAASALTAWFYTLKICSALNK